MEYETVIGLEVHVQLDTRSKMFCGCPADYQSAEPNTRTCPVCLGLPGALPVINRRAVEFTVMTGLALHCRIPEFTKFDRKNYPYPDLMKGYQISQYDLPLARNGYVEIDGDPDLQYGGRPIGVERVHLEEDVAKMQHFPASPENHAEGYSLVDVNRSGVPLMEIVSKPDLRSPEEARQYLTSLHSMVQYLGVSTGNMQDGNFRCDANVSIRPAGSDTFGTRTEVKNMNSFRSVYLALEYEVERQRRVVEDGGTVVQETRGWVDDRSVTVSQRSKEYAHDYRYFPEPDLPPLNIGSEWVDRMQSALPELAPQRKDRFQEEYELSEYDADQLTVSRAMADYFEEVNKCAQLWQREPKPQGKDPSTTQELLQWESKGGDVNALHIADLGFHESPTLARRCLVEQWRFGLLDGEWIGSPYKFSDFSPFTLRNWRTRLRDHSKEVANWITGDLSYLLNQDRRDIADCPVSPSALSELLGLIADGTLSTSLAKGVLEEMYKRGKAAVGRGRGAEFSVNLSRAAGTTTSAADIVEELGLAQISDTGAIETAVAEAIAANPKAVTDYLSGKETAARFLMGQVMRITRGQAQPELALQLVQAGLEAQRQ